MKGTGSSLSLCVSLCFKDLQHFPPNHLLIDALISSDQQVIHREISHCQ